MSVAAAVVEVQEKEEVPNQIQLLKQLKLRVRAAEHGGTYEEVCRGRGLHPTYEQCNLRSRGEVEREPDKCTVEVICCTFGSCGRVINIHQR